MIKTYRNQLVQEISNEDIVWDGTFAGLMPVKISGASLVLLNEAYSEDLNPPLLDALADEDRFVAAHVLLTNLTDIQLPPAQNRQIFSLWNGLYVNLIANGEIIYGSNPKELQQLWQTALANIGH